MPHFKLALLGFGNVGQALAELLLRKQQDLFAQYDLSFQVNGIATGHHGTAVNHQGLDLSVALDLLRNGKSLDQLSTAPIPNNSLDFIRNSQADVLFENTPVNYQTGQPAIDHLRTALELGMHALTANKGPVVHAYRQLTRVAETNGVRFYFESTVMDGAPIFSLFRGSLPAARLVSFKGIFNSTTNLILSRMEEGDTFEQAVKFAQQIGIAETDPSGDIDGWDAAIKVAALVNVLMGIEIKPDQIERQGIREITLEQVRQAQKENKRWKLLCTARRSVDEVTARVYPELVPLESPFYNVTGTTSIVQFETDVLGLLSVIESDPGPQTTAYGLLADFLNATLS